MELYNAIFYRKSIRSYSNTKIKAPLMEEVKNICSNITYLNEDLNIKAHVVERGHLIHFLMGKKCKVKAPHYILVTSNKGDEYLQNIGYAMEKVVLQLTTLGLATCWLECTVNRDDITEFIDLKDCEEEIDLTEKLEESNEDIDNTEYPVAIISFGYPEESQELFRNLDSKVDREKIKDISKRVDKEWNEYLDAVRMAPSVKNIQPWFFVNDRRGFHIYQKSQKKSLDDMSKISMGIALRHFDIVCEVKETNVKYEKIDARKRIGKEYFISIKS